MIDSGAQCNVIPLALYEKATRGYNLTHVTPAQYITVAYGGYKMPGVGLVRIRVWRGDYHCLVECKLVDSSTIRPILGRNACTAMHLINTWTMMQQTNQSQPHTFML